MLRKKQLIFAAVWWSNTRPWQPCWQCLNAEWVASHLLTEIPILARTGYVITYPAWLASQLTSKENHHYPIQCLGNDTFQYFNIDPAVGFPRFSYIYFFKPKYHSAYWYSRVYIDKHHHIAKEKTIAYSYCSYKLSIAGLVIPTWRFRGAPHPGDLHQCSKVESCRKGFPADDVDDGTTFHPNISQPVFCVSSGCWDAGPSTRF